MAAYEHAIVLNIRRCMSNGLEVYDRQGMKVGLVDNYEPVTGYMMVRTNPFADTELIIPFSVVTHIDPRELFVSDTRDELLRKYTNPPPRTVEVTEKIDPDTGENDTRTVITLPSGYDGTPIVVGCTKTGTLARHIAPGYEVYTSGSEFVGRVNRYDHTVDSLLVVAGQFHKIDMAIPLALVETVNSATGEIFLAVSTADLQRFHSEPSAVLKVRASDATR